MKRISQHELYGTWAAMLNRCYNPRQKSYRYYGQRGIEVCDRWRHSFTNFLADMGERPSKKHMIERRDNDGPYSPTNCIWALREDQVKNKRNNRYITANGETLHMAEWARRLGVNPAAILYRLNKGWSEEQAVTVPRPDKPNAKLTRRKAEKIRSLYPQQSMAEIAGQFGVSKKTVLNIVHDKIWNA
jgi:hypothetical protein